MLTIDLLRHGALQGGTRYRGQLDDPLSAEGRHSMERVWQHVAHQVEGVICSPLQRCRQPAEAWSAKLRLPLQVDARLAELHYGDWEGKTMEEINLTHREMLRQWRCDPSGMTPPGGESMDVFCQRLSVFWQQLCGQEGARHRLIVGHSGVNRTLLAIALGASLASSRTMAMPYACWSRLQHENGATLLAFHDRQP